MDPHNMFNKFFAKVQMKLNEELLVFIATDSWKIWHLYTKEKRISGRLGS